MIQEGCSRGVGKRHLELAWFYSGRMAAMHLLYLLDSSSEVCKGLTKCSKNHLVVSSEFWKSADYFCNILQKH